MTLIFPVLAATIINFNFINPVSGFYCECKVVQSEYPATCNREDRTLNNLQFVVRSEKTGLLATADVEVTCE